MVAFRSSSKKSAREVSPASDHPENVLDTDISVKAYMICAFAAFGGILFGYDSGYINGVIGMPYFKYHFGHPDKKDLSGYNITTSQKSFIVCVLSAGTFCGALTGAPLADYLGRRWSIVIACVIFSIGVIVQCIAEYDGVLAGGRVIAGFGVGLVSAVVVMFMSEVAPRKIRGSIVSGYQWAITIGLLLAACANKGTSKIWGPLAYRIPIAIQFLWAIILAAGCIWLPDSPRYYMKKHQKDKALAALIRLRDLPADHPAILYEIKEIEETFAKEEAEASMTKWTDLFRGWSTGGPGRRIFIGFFLQMFQQWTGVNFIFYYGTTFFQQSGLKDAFLVGLICNMVNVITTPASFWLIEKKGRRPLLIWGAAVMTVCEFIVAGVGVAMPGSPAASMCLIVFVCIYICAFATTWGPTAWVTVGEIYPLSIRARGVAISTASNWLWNFVIGFVTPYMVDDDYLNMKAKVFFIWGTTCCMSGIFAYYFVPETKGMSLEEVDAMFADQTVTPRNSHLYRPHAHAHRNEVDLQEEGIVNVSEELEGEKSPSALTAPAASHQL